MNTVESNFDPIYTEMIEYFGSPTATANHFGIDVRAVYQWKEKVPKTRIREFNLIKEISKKLNPAA